MAVTNPQNREMALRAGLSRHGFAVGGVAFPATLVDRAALMAWLIETYSARDEQDGA